MNSNDKDELDDELIKSMKKLVEEETNVAKAFIDTQNELSDEDDELAYDYITPYHYVNLSYPHFIMI